MQIGLQGYAYMPDALAGLSRAERVTYCNDAWQQAHPRVAALDFSRDRKMMSVLVRRSGSGFSLFLKVRNWWLLVPMSTSPLCRLAYFGRQVCLRQHTDQLQRCLAVLDDHCYGASQPTCR